MREDRLQCLNSQGFHRLHYTDWGDPANPRVVICVHGLTRNCRDFDALAGALQDQLRVVNTLKATISQIKALGFKPGGVTTRS